MGRNDEHGATMLNLTWQRVFAWMATPKYGETLHDTNRYKQINNTLFRQRLTAGSATDLERLGLTP